MSADINDKPTITSTTATKDPKTAKVTIRISGTNFIDGETTVYIGPNLVDNSCVNVNSSSITVVVPGNIQFCKSGRERV